MTQQTDDPAAQVELADSFNRIFSGTGTLIAD